MQSLLHRSVQIGSLRLDELGTQMLTLLCGVTCQRVNHLASSLHLLPLQLLLAEWLHCHRVLLQGYRISLHRQRVALHSQRIALAKRSILALHTRFIHRWFTLRHMRLTCSLTTLCTLHTLRHCASSWHMCATFGRAITHLWSIATLRSIALRSSTTLNVTLGVTLGIALLGSLGSPLERILQSLLNLLADRESSVDKHRVRRDKHRVTLCRIVAYERRILGDEYIAWLLPILAPIAKEEHLLHPVVNLNIATEACIVAISIVVERIAHQLLILGEDVAISV